MAAYRQVYGFGHLRADCQGPGSALDPYACFEYGNFIFTLRVTEMVVITGAITRSSADADNRLDLETQVRGHSRSLKMSPCDSNTYDFLLTFYSNDGSISCRF